MSPTVDGAVAGVIEALTKAHRRHEADAADRLAEGLQIVRPDEDPNRLHEAADWVAATCVAATNAAARAGVEHQLREAFSIDLPTRRRREVERVIAAERARLEESAGVALLEPALAVLDLPEHPVGAR